MTGPEHYREAELLLSSADQQVQIGQPDKARATVAAAQVHATLALVAVTDRGVACRPNASDVFPGMPG